MEKKGTEKKKTQRTIDENRCSSIHQKSGTTRDATANKLSGTEDEDVRELTLTMTG